MDPTSISIGGQPVGAKHPPFVIAEAGVHHYNSLELARAYVREARLAGADAVKFQTYDADLLVTEWAPTYWDDDGDRTQHEVFTDRSKLDEEDYSELFHYAEEVGILLLSTPFDETAVAMLDDLGMEAFKVASADLTNHPLLQAIAQTGKPVLLSTGASFLEEIREAVAVVEGCQSPISLLHCSLAYPTPVRDANLDRIRLLRSAFPEHVLGYSDHTTPDVTELTCPLAVGLGARVIEKHFTLSPHLSGDDHYHAVDPAGLARLVEGCRHAWEMTLPGVEVTESEESAREFARRSIVAARPLEAGRLLGEDDVAFKRPGTGIPPSELDRVVGATLVNGRGYDELIRDEDLA